MGCVGPDADESSRQEDQHCRVLHCLQEQFQISARTHRQPRHANIHPTLILRPSGADVPAQPCMFVEERGTARRVAASESEAESLRGRRSALEPVFAVLDSALHVVSTR